MIPVNICVFSQVSGVGLGFGGLFAFDMCNQSDIVSDRRDILDIQFYCLGQCFKGPKVCHAKPLAN
jgi:hypothetical protein